MASDMDRTDEDRAATPFKMFYLGMATSGASGAAMTTAVVAEQYALAVLFAFVTLLLVTYGVALARRSTGA